MTSTLGGFVDFGAGSLQRLHGPETVFTHEQIAKLFDVPTELIGDERTSTFALYQHYTDELVAALNRAQATRVHRLAVDLVGLKD